MTNLDVCRLCLDTAEGLDELTHRLIRIISTCFSLKICLSSKLTNKVCQICIDQLVNVYKYRKKILKNEKILCKKFKKHTRNNSVKIDCNNLQKEIDTADYEYDSNITVYDKQKTEIENQEKYTILENEVENTEFKDKDQKIELNELIGYQHDEKLYYPVTTKVNEDTLQENGSIMDESTLVSNKENTDMNSLTTYFNDTKTTSFTEKNKNTDVVDNEDKLYVYYLDKKFMCLTCLKVFDSQKKLSIHYKTVELSRASETSKKNNDINMVKGSKNVDNKMGFKCDICSKVFTDKALIIKHIQEHNIDRPFLCNLCGRTYKSVREILRHGVVHNGDKFFCTHECGFSTVHLSALREHVKRHKKEFKYKCDQCDKCFQVKTWYEQHQNVHNKVRPFVCKVCGQAFSMERYLAAHRARLHHQSSRVKRYKCVHCGLPCDSRKSLVTHMKQAHDMKTDCLCDVCGQVFPNRHRLNLHKIMHAERKYSCGTCKKTFNKKHHQTVHEKIHTGERLNCNLCPRSFTQRCSLRRHVKRCHSGEQKSVHQKF